MFKKGQSGNPAGRPKGICTHATNIRKMLTPHIPALVEKAVSMALEGDATALRVCLERVSPALKAASANIEFNIGKASLAQYGESIIELMAKGDISPTDGQEVLNSLATQGKIKEVTELEERIKELELKSS